MSKAELSAFMHIERDSIDYKTKIEQQKIVNFIVFAGLLAPFYQFYKGMRLLGLSALVPFCYIQFNLYYHHGDLSEQFLNFSSMVSTSVMLLLLLFNDYIYLRFSANKIRRIRCLVPAEEQSGSDYYDFLRIMGTPSITRGIIETLISSFLFLMLVYRFL